MDTITCRHCNKPFSRTMRYCPFCGGEYKRGVKIQKPICPRCECKLENHSYREADLDICPKCSGLWLDYGEFRQLTSERDTYRDDSIPYEYTRKPVPEETQYLVCPRCGTLMNRRNFRKISGVLIDVCRDHGVWLDAGELEQIRCFVANGGLEDSQDKQIQRNREQIEDVARNVKDVELMQRVLHKWNVKRWILSGF